MKANNTDTFDVPILFIIFNRPDLTKRTFERLREIRPKLLFIAADGPREKRKGEADLCSQSRLVTENIDWPCKVIRRYQSKNMGCKKHVSSSIDWLFESVEKGVILEDDVLPAHSFFSFCQSMLDIYKNDQEIMAINGACFIDNHELQRNTAGYRFSRLVHVWGWATWKRAWKRYDIKMSHIDDLLKPEYTELFEEKKSMQYWVKHFKHINKYEIDTWDAQWQYSILYSKGIVVSPDTNMVENIGFRSDATHTTSAGKGLLASESDTSNLGRIKIHVDTKFDNISMKKLHIKSLIVRILSRINIFI